MGDEKDEWLNYAFDWIEPMMCEYSTIWKNFERYCITRAPHHEVSKYIINGRYFIVEQEPPITLPFIQLIALEDSSYDYNVEEAILFCTKEQGYDLVEHWGLPLTWEYPETLHEVLEIVFVDLDGSVVSMQDFSGQIS